MALPQPPPPPPPQTATCFRHPGREAGRRCTRCGRPACSQCLVQASVGSHCVECARAARPDVKTRARYWNARQPTLVTYTLIAINLAVFVWIGIQVPETIGGSAPLTLDNPQTDLVLFGPLVEQGEWYRLVTSGFVHFGIIHLAFNMLLLFQLGQLLEPEIGRIRFALLYFAALFAGSAGVLLLDPNAPTGGASGAVFGLMGAAFIGLRNRGINPMTTGLGTTLLLNLLLTFSISNISIGGHIGGLVGGALAGWVVLAPAYRRLPVWTSYAAPAAVIGIAAAVSMVAVNT
jgi:membrane associated rhomboid family serine protease